MNRRILLSLALLVAAVGASTALGDAVAFPTFGIAFTPPAQTNLALTDSPGCVALYPFDKTSAIAGAALCVEWVPGHGATADQMAQTMVQKNGATIVPGSFTIGGETATKLTAEFSMGLITHRVTCLVGHGKYIYMISAFDTATADAGKALDDFIATVSFSAPESPAKHLDKLSDPAWPIFGTFSMKMVDCARKFDSEAALLNVGINDLSGEKMKQPFSVDIEPIQIPKPVTFAEIEKAYSGNMAKSLNLPADKPLAWHVQDGVADLNVTDAFEVVMKHDDGSSEKHTMKLAILQLSPGNFVQFIFSIHDLPKEETDAYAHVSDQMLGTVKVIPQNGK